MRRIGILVLTVLALSCVQKKADKAPAPRRFPMAEIPGMIEDPEERASWLSAHFWDRFTDTSEVFACDSLLINGVAAEDVEKQTGTFATLLGSLPLKDGARAMSNLYSRIEAFQLAHPESNMFERMADITSHYFFNPNSPVRSEDLYLPFVSGMASSPLVPDAEKGRYVWDRDVCMLNRTGSKATDFSFRDVDGRSRTLHGIKGSLVLLIFGNPECNACREIMDALEGDPRISALLESGKLVRVEVNPDDYDFLSGEGRLYAIRAIPSLYLLDSDKTVLAKDAPLEKILEKLSVKKIPYLL